MEVSVGLGHARIIYTGSLRAEESLFNAPFGRLHGMHGVEQESGNTLPLYSPTFQSAEDQRTF